MVSAQSYPVQLCSAHVSVCRFGVSTFPLSLHVSSWFKEKSLMFSLPGVCCEMESLYPSSSYIVPKGRSFMKSLVPRLKTGQLLLLSTYYGLSVTVETVVPPLVKAFRQRDH